MARIPNKSETTIPGTGLLTKALDVVDIIASSHDRVKMRDIVEATGHTKPTLYRIISALVQRGMIEQDPRDHAYSLGPRFTELASMVARNTELISLAALPLATLASKHGERVNLGALEGSSLRTMASWGGFGEALSTNVGGRKPLYCTGLGKVLLAFQPENIRNAILQDTLFEAHTPKTHVTVESLLADLDTIKVCGFATDDEEIIEGWRCVSVPILDSNGLAIAAISVTAPEFRMSQERLHQIAADLREAAQSIAQRLPSGTAGRKTPLQIPQKENEFLADPFHFFGPSAILLKEPTSKSGGYLVADKMGARLLDVSQTGSEVVCQATAPIHDAAVHDGVVFLLSGGTVYRCDVAGRDQEPVPLLRPDEISPDAIAIAETGALIIGAGTEVFTQNADGDLKQIASDRVAGTAFGKLHGKLAYVSEQGIRQLGEDSVLTVPAGLKDFKQVGDRIYLIDAADWMLHCVDLKTGAQCKPLSLPVPKPTTLAYDPDTSCLLVGSERIGLSDSLIELAPMSGRVIRIKISENKLTEETK